MIHNDILNTLQLLVKTSAPPLISVADQALGTPQWTAGQQIPAYVLASLPNGRFQVQVGGQTLDLNLPSNTQPGETLQLTYLTDSPRMTFALVQTAASALPGNSSVSLSDTARFIGNLVQNPSPGFAQTAQAGKISTPLVLNDAPADIPAFAQALRTSVSQSGLFYEAHQVQWLNGERSLTSLRQEPQGQLAPLHPQESSAVRPGASSLPPTASSAGSAPAVEDGVHPQALSLVQQQLQVLGDRQVFWQGNVWPGQAMDWTIEEQSARQGAQQDDAAPTWHTRLSLQLPTLGGVSAKLTLVGGALQLDISAQDDASVSLMRLGQADLAERFAASGLQLSGFTIQHG
ncbi:flagellar hook-length control protein FliK [mine drainage metagenome]|uniref:Flagellar hook-length control protein FliK n=1 Tax=mine drainage metagenome TaxID=410659 RepID=A0A1J5R0B4_9ZZZZ